MGLKEKEGHSGGCGNGWLVLSKLSCRGWPTGGEERVLL